MPLFFKPVFFIDPLFPGRRGGGIVDAFMRGFGLSDSKKTATAKPTFGEIEDVNVEDFKIPAGFQIPRGKNSGKNVFYNVSNLC